MSKDVGIYGYGTWLYLSDMETSPTYNQVKGITKWDIDAGGAGSPEKLKVTSGSTATMVHEYLDGFAEKRFGTLKFTMLYDAGNSQHAQMEAASRAGTVLSWKIKIKSKLGTRTASFTGIISEFPVGVEYDKITTVPVSISITEDTWTPLTLTPAEDHTGVTGLEDATFSGTYVGNDTFDFRVKITGTGTPDKFQYSLDGGVTYNGSDINILGTAQLIANGVKVTFGATTGHTLNDVWKYVAT